MTIQKKVNVSAPLPVVADPFLSLRPDVVAAGQRKAEVDSAQVAYNKQAEAVLAWLTGRDLGTDHLETKSFRPVFTAAFAEGLLSQEAFAAWQASEAAPRGAKGAGKGSETEILRKKVQDAVSGFIQRVKDFAEVHAAAGATGAAVEYRDTGKPCIAGAKGASRTTKALLERLDEVATKALDWIKADADKDAPTFKGDVAELRRVTLAYRQSIRDLNKSPEPKH